MRNKHSPRSDSDSKRVNAIIFSVFLLSSVFALVGSSTIASGEESDEMQITTSESADSGQVVAASGSNRFVVWQDDTPGNSDIMFKRSTDNGATWKTTLNLSNNPGDSAQHRLVVDGVNVYVAWIQANSGGDRFDVYFRRSLDNGATWGPKLNISTNGQSGSFALGVASQYVYIAFPSGDELSFRRSSNHGDSFGSKATLTGSFNGALALATSGSHVYVAWENSELAPIVRHSANNAASWEPEVELPGSDQNGLDALRLAATGSFVYAIWQEAVGCGGDTEIMFSRSVNNGETWEDEVTIGGCGDGALVNFLAMAVSGNRIFILYSDLGDIFVKRSADNGAAWKARVNLSNNPGDSLWNGIAIQGTNVYVVWTQLSADRTLADIFLKRSTDNGVSWKTSKNVSNNAGWSEHGQVAASSSNVYFTWDDATEGDSEILFRRSTDSGATFKSVVRISNNDGSSTIPRMITTGQNIFIVWTDDSPSNNDILHRRTTDNGATWKTTQNLSNNAGSSQSPQMAG